MKSGRESEEADDMMTHGEIKDAIEQLRELGSDGRITKEDIMNAVFIGNNYKVRDKLIELLEQAEPDTHMELPRDADGVPVHIGDEVESDHREGGTVVGIQYYEGVGVLIAVKPRNWDTPSWCDPAEYRHHHKPTVSEILDELEGLRGTGDYESVVMRAAELAGMLRELMADDDAQ